MFEADRLHRSETQRIDAARCNFLDRQTAFEMHSLLEVVQGIDLRADQRLQEGLVLLAIYRRVEVIGAGPLAIPRFPVQLRKVERVCRQNRSDGVVEIEDVASEKVI